MGRAITAGAAYALIVFVLGFFLGALRVFSIAPAIGATKAVSLEAPLILAVSWFISRWCINRLDVRRTVMVRSAMGIVAFALLMTLEFGLSLVLFRRSVEDYVVAFGSLAGEIGLCAQVAFAVLPVIQVWRR